MKSNNPIIPHKGVCDPHIHVFNHKAYLYASHDKSIANPTWLMDDWQIWSSDDLVEWHYESTFRPEDTYIGKCDTCWAVDAAQRGGKYYYYFSNGNTDTGVAVSDSPTGPFVDALGKPLLPKDLTETAQYDPTVFVDPDTDVPYIIWGGGMGYYIARLQEDMISLAEDPRQILVDGKLAWDDKSFIHKKNGLFYLTWASWYATSESIYGPYTTRGNVGISEDHGSWFEWNGQDFYAYTILDPYRFYRSTGLCYVHYRANGEIVADDLIAEYGVGLYDAEWRKIKAAWYMKGVHVSKLDNIWGGFDVSVQNGSELYYPNVYGLEKKSKIWFWANCEAADGVWVDVWNDRTNQKIAQCHIPYTGMPNQTGYEIFGCRLHAAHTDPEKSSLRFTFRGDGENLLRLHWFRFE